MKDFFISYNRADRSWAEWIAWTLEEAGYSVVIQAWDFRPGENFVLEMQNAAVETKKTIAVLSPNYLSSAYTRPEWAAAFNRDPTGNVRSLIPIRVKECTPTGLLSTIAYIDIVGQSKTDARSAILGGLGERGKPDTAPDFPGHPAEASHFAEERVAPTPAQYPGTRKAASLTKSLIAAKEGEEHTGESITPDSRSNQDEAISADTRLDLAKELNSLVPQQFNMIVYAIDPPPGLIPPMPAAQADRTIALLAWAESPGGCGTAAIQRILGEIKVRTAKKKRNKNYLVAIAIFVLIAGAYTAWALTRPTKMVPLLVRTEPGSKIFVDGVYLGETDSGTFEAAIRTGLHKISVENDCFEKRHEEARQVEYGRPVEVVQAATPRTQAEFKLDEFKNKDRWDVPESWVIRKDDESKPDGRLYIDGSAMKLGIARGAYFRNFTAVFQLRLVNGIGAAWALRIKDPENYYLFYLSRGETGSKTFCTIDSYIVSKGVIDPASKDFPQQKLYVRLTSTDEYTIMIEAKGHTIKHTISSGESGEEDTGLFTDIDNRYPCGGIGFILFRGEEKFSIDDFSVVPPNLKLYEEPETTAK